eukprot:scaffold1046_cov162-Ochromonas_danica.AAC.32
MRRRRMSHAHSRASSATSSAAVNRHFLSTSRPSAKAFTCSTNFICTACSRARNCFPRATAGASRPTAWAAGDEEGEQRRAISSSQCCNSWSALFIAAKISSIQAATAAARVEEARQLSQRCCRASSQRARSRGRRA